MKYFVVKDFIEETTLKVTKNFMKCGVGTSFLFPCRKKSTVLKIGEVDLK